MHHWIAFSLPGGWEKDASGYLASGLVLCTFSVRSMRLLRWLGITSNLAFIGYAIITGMTPILMLHSLLLPMNVYRLIQLERACREDAAQHEPVPWQDRTGDDAALEFQP